MINKTGRYDHRNNSIKYFPRCFIYKMFLQEKRRCTDAPAFFLPGNKSSSEAGGNPDFICLTVRLPAKQTLLVLQQMIQNDHSPVHMSFRSCYRHKKTSKAADLCVLSVCFRGIIYISGLFFCSLPSDVFLKNQAVEHCLLTIPDSMRASVSDRLPFRIVCRQTISAVTAAPFFIRQEVCAAAGTFLLRNEISPCFLTLRITGPLQLQGTRLFFSAQVCRSPAAVSCGSQHQHQ